MKESQARGLALLILTIVVLAIFAYGVLTDTRRVAGVSMLPTLEDGDLVVLQKVPFSSISAGDIIVYTPPCSATGFSVIHRVVQVTQGGLITQGDDRLTNPQTDQSAGIATGPITANCVAGEVVFVVPYLERIADLPYGANYAIAFLIVDVIVLMELAPRRETDEKSNGQDATTHETGVPENRQESSG